MKRLSTPRRGVLPRLLLLDQPDKDGEPRAALIHPGRMPAVYSTLTRAVDALRMEDTR